MMNNFDKVKKVIKDNYQYAQFGLFNSRNTVGDPMHTIYRDGTLRVDICYAYEYFEVFGLSKEEFRKLKDFYNKL